MFLRAYKIVSQSVRFVETSLLLSSLFAIILLTVLQIILRNFFSFSLSWIEPLNQHLVLVIAFVGAMVAGRKGEHISFDVARHYLPVRFQKSFSTMGNVLSAIVCLYLADLCARLTFLDYLDPLPAFGRVPQWIFELFIPLGFFVLGYRFLKSAVSINLRGETPTDGSS